MGTLNLVTKPNSNTLLRIDLTSALRLIVITDHHLARPRKVVEIVEAALLGGAKAIQLRNKGDSANELLKTGKQLRDLTRAHEALLFVNDRVDIALSIEADGVHLGPQDPPLQDVRRIVPDEFIIGFSADDPDSYHREPLGRDHEPSNCRSLGSGRDGSGSRQCNYERTGRNASNLFDVYGTRDQLKSHRSG